VPVDEGIMRDITIQGQDGTSLHDLLMTNTAYRQQFTNAGVRPATINHIASQNPTYEVGYGTSTGVWTRAVIETDIIGNLFRTGTTHKAVAEGNAHLHTTPITDIRQCLGDVAEVMMTAAVNPIISAMLIDIPSCLSLPNVSPPF